MNLQRVAFGSLCIPSIKLICTALPMGDMKQLFHTLRRRKMRCGARYLSTRRGAVVDMKRIVLLVMFSPWVVLSVLRCNIHRLPLRVRSDEIISRNRRVPRLG
jgi:hypothetical protein